MDFQFIRTEKKNRLGFITLSRPEKKNAFNEVLVSELTTIITSFENDQEVKVMILRAEGDVFSAGADLDYLQKLQKFSFEENLEDSRHLKDLFRKIYTNKKIIIAQVEGHAIAGGCGLATICDFCFAVPEAKFGYTEVKIGFIPAIVSVFLIRKISGSNVRELLLSGKLIPAAEAREIGLITRVIDKSKITTEVEEFALQLCDETSSQSIASTKELLSKIYSQDLDSALEYAAEMNARTRASDDCKKGIDSFLRKEKLKW